MVLLQRPQLCWLDYRPSTDPMHPRPPGLLVQWRDRTGDRDEPIHEGLVVTVRTTAVHPWTLDVRWHRRSLIHPLDPLRDRELETHRLAAADPSARRPQAPLPQLCWQNLRPSADPPDMRLASILLQWRPDSGQVQQHRPRPRTNQTAERGDADRSAPGWEGLVVSAMIDWDDNWSLSTAWLPVKEVDPINPLTDPELAVNRELSAKRLAEGARP
jgi:hypothetical protein